MPKVSPDVPRRELARVLLQLPEPDRQRAAQEFHSMLGVMQEWAVDGKSVLTELLPAGAAPRPYQHHPEGNAHDPVTGFRWFYHSHPAKRRSVPDEHGHFHLFADLPALRTTHLMALSIDARGVPIGAFLPNLWVTEDQSQTWEEISTRVDAFETHCPAVSTSAQTWLGHAVQTFRNALPVLWRHRQKRIEALQRAGQRQLSQNQRVEVLSRCSLELDTWAQALQR